MKINIITKYSILYVHKYFTCFCLQRQQILMSYICMEKKEDIQEMPSYRVFCSFSKRMFIRLKTGLEILGMGGCTRLLTGSVQLSQ